MADPQATAGPPDDPVMRIKRAALGLFKNGDGPAFEAVVRAVLRADPQATKGGTPEAVAHLEREDLAQTCEQFANVVCPRLSEVLVPFGATEAGWADAADQLRRAAALLRGATKGGGTGEPPNELPEDLWNLMHKWRIAHGEWEAEVAERGELDRIADQIRARIAALRSGDTKGGGTGEPT